MRLPVFAVLLLVPAVGFAQPDPNANGNGKIAVEIMPSMAARGEVVTVRFTVTPNPGCTTYPFFPTKEQTSKNTYLSDARDPLVYLAPPVDPTDGLKEKRDRTTFKSEGMVYEKAVTWEVKAVVDPKAAPGPGPIKLKAFHVQLCKTNCETTKGLTAAFEITDAPAKEVPAEFRDLVAARQATPSGSAVATTGGGLSAQEFAVFLGQAAFWGLVSLVTPCVFPMIPITVSLFLKQSNQSAGGAVKLAAVYCATIVLVLGLGAWLALGAFVQLSRAPLTNVLLAVMLLVFACSLFGWFDIRLPNFLLKGADAGRKKGGLLGTVFGAVAFSIVSFTCVAPFLGGFAGLSANPNFQWYHLLLGGLTFGTAFAAPFFLLALFPSMMKKLPRAGGWMDTVKAIMGFLELAAAFKFARTAELLWNDPTVYFTYDVCLAAFAVISAACGLYLLGLFRLPHDDADRGKLHVLQLLLSLGFLGFALYLVPGLFHQPGGENQRPKGIVFAWVDSFLLPDTKKALRDLDGEVKRISTELAAGRTPAKRFIFVDFTGKTCTNCKLNEENVFPLPQVKGLLDQYTLVKLYTDDVPEVLYDGTPPPPAERRAEADRNDQLLSDKFGTRQLPTYVILEPQASGEPKVVGIYREGLINDVPAFVKFLQEPLMAK